MRSASDGGRGDGESDRRPASAAIEDHLSTALDDADRLETRYHIRQALQLVEALGGPE